MKLFLDILGRIGFALAVAWIFVTIFDTRSRDDANFTLHLRTCEVLQKLAKTHADSVKVFETRPKPDGYPCAAYLDVVIVHKTPEH